MTYLINKHAQPAKRLFDNYCQSVGGYLPGRVIDRQGAGSIDLLLFGSKFRRKSCHAQDSFTFRGFFYRIGGRQADDTPDGK